MKEINTNELEDIIREDKINVVKFGAAWCTECAILNVKFAGIESDFSDIGFYDLNIENDLATADKYGINELPLLIAFKNGIEISRWNQSIGDLRGWLKMLQW